MTGESDHRHGTVDPSAMTVDEAATLLKVDAASVRRHVAEGLPCDAAGRIHLVTYVAWMVGRLHRDEPFVTKPMRT